MRMADLELHILRDVFHMTTTLGLFTVDRKPFGYSCEDEDRGLDATVPASLAAKVRGDTAIPVGRYRVTKTMSQRFGRPMLLVNLVPDFGGVRLHEGNDEADTDGCPLVGLGRNTQRLEVYNSRRAIAWLEREYDRRTAAGDLCYLTVERDALAWANYRRSA